MARPSLSMRRRAGRASMATTTRRRSRASTAKVWSTPVFAAGPRSRAPRRAGATLTARRSIAGTCRSLAPAEARARLARGEKAAFRLDMRRALDAAPAPLCWSEYGEGAVPCERPAEPAVWGDVVLRGRDLAASYHLAVVVDDALQGVTDVVRGRDLLAATAVHRLLQALLGLAGAALSAPPARSRRRAGRNCRKAVNPGRLPNCARRGLSPGEVRAALGFGAAPAGGDCGRVQLKLRGRGDRRERRLLRRHRRRGGRLRHELIDPVALPLERRKHPAVELARAGELDRHRVDEVAVDDHLVMQVRAGRQSRIAEITDGLALGDARALDDRRGRSRTCDCRWSHSRWRAGFRPAARSRSPTRP